MFSRVLTDPVWYLYLFWLMNALSLSTSSPSIGNGSFRRTSSTVTVISVYSHDQGGSLSPA